MKAVALAPLNIELDCAAITRILPHRGLALVIHRALIKTPTKALGYFSVRADDQRIMDHFGVMPGVLIGEFAHLTGAVLLLHGGGDREMLPTLSQTTVEILGPVFPGDNLVCEVSLDRQEGRKSHFLADICTDSGTEIAIVAFRGILVPKRLLERQLLSRRIQLR